MTSLQTQPVQTHSAPFRREIVRAGKEAKKIERRIERAIANGQHHKARSLRNILLTSRDGKRAALVEANKRSHNQHRLRHCNSLPIADSLDLRNPSAEPIRCYGKQKGPGRSYRLIHSFGPINRAKQLLTKWAVRPLCEIDSRAYMSRGRDTAVEAVLDNVRSGEWRWVAEIDVRDYYPSINQERLATLIPVGRATYDTVIVSREAEREYPNLSKLHAAGIGTTAFVRGLPQGAATSPLAADLLVTYVLRSLPTDFDVVNYGDNFWIGARTKRELALKQRTLEEGFALASAQSLVLVRKQLRRVDWGFDCLGYRIKKKRFLTSVKPTAENQSKCMKQCGKLSRKRGRRAGPRFLQLLKSWRASFKFWDHGDRWCRNLAFKCGSSGVRASFVTSRARAHFSDRVRLVFG